MGTGSPVFTTQQESLHARHLQALLIGSLVLLMGAAALAHETAFPIPGDTVEVSDTKLKFDVRNAPEISLRHDPATEGFDLLVRGVGEGAGHSGLISLDPTLWSPIFKPDPAMAGAVGAGAPPTTPVVRALVGYRYKDHLGTRGGVRDVELRSGELRIKGSGKPWGWKAGGPYDAVEVYITINDETFCARGGGGELGGTVVKNDARHFKALGALPPEECPAQVCGNGQLEQGEECDDGNLNEVDGCTSQCRIGPCELDPGINSTFEAIQAVIFDSPVYGCTSGVCHGGGSQQGNLSLEEAVSYENLVGIDSFGSTVKRVEPGEPELSYLFQLLSANTLGTEIPGGGTPMPTGGGRALTEDHLEGVKRWIRGGGPRDLVVEGTAELLGSCLPPANALKIPEPDPPFEGFGVQLRQTPWPLPAESEDEICMATYYDVSALVPEWAKVPCQPRMVNVNNPSGECFAYHKQVLLQDPQSHHSIIHTYTGEFPVDHRGWGEFTRKSDDPDLPPELCDPKDIDPATGQNPGCSGAVVSGIACIGYGPPDYTFGGANAPTFSGSQEPFLEQEFAPGVYSILPAAGVIVWNSHAFNLTHDDSSMSQYLNLFFAGRGDQLFPARGIFDAGSIFVQNVPPFQTREYCRTYTAPVGAEIFDLGSHTHRHGDLFRIWAPPNTPCTPGPDCKPRPDEPIYYSTEYSDPVQLSLDPPLQHPDAGVESRTYLYCSLYDNGATRNSRGEERHPVKRQSTSPEPPLVFGRPLGPGGPCPDAPGNPGNGVRCLNGPRRGFVCHGNDSECDSAPGAGDGICDACPVRGGVTTEDEMLIMLGTFFIDDGSTSGTRITKDNVSALSLKWDFPLAGGVTSSPVVTETFVYVTSWDGKVYALNKETGEVIWSFDTGSGVAIGIQPTVTLGPGGQVIFGDSLATLRMLDGKTGDLIWSRLLGNPAVDHIWGAATVANNRIFVGVASHSDQPCTNGRLVALDLETGNLLWTRENVPEGVCSNDTSLECSQDSHCGGGTCRDAVGAGVTAQPAVDATGDHVYVNTVGCYTFPSVGDSDAMMKLDAATGATVWVTRVDAPEQFGFCADSPAIECSARAHCGGSACTKKAFYHDFGFLNGPTVVEVDDGLGGTRTLLVSGSKNGTLYAFDESDGSVAWSNAVQPKPVTPGFAGFGLFNGGLEYADGRFYAALFRMVVVGLPEVEHLMSFDENDGSIVWTDDIGRAWANPLVSNGVLFTGTNVAPRFYAYDAETGQRRATFFLPEISSSKAAVDGTSLYVGYGIFGDVGGVRAYILP